MSGIKGFSIVTIIFLLIGFLFIGISRGEELTDEEYEKLYKQELLHEINVPLSIITRVYYKEETHRTFEDIRSSYFLVDIFKNMSFSLFLGYEEFTTEKLAIDKIVLDKKIEIEFLQDDEAFEHRKKNSSFVVFPLLPEQTKNGKNTLVEIYFKDNKMGVIKKEFVIFSKQVDEVFDEIEKWYKVKEMKKPKMMV
jgi:hypothetical protein